MRCPECGAKDSMEEINENTRYCNDCGANIHIHKEANGNEE